MAQQMTALHGLLHDAEHYGRESNPDDFTVRKSLVIVWSPQSHCSASSEHM